MWCRSSQTEREDYHFNRFNSSPSHKTTVHVLNPPQLTQPWIPINVKNTDNCTLLVIAACSPTNYIRKKLISFLPIYVLTSYYDTWNNTANVILFVSVILQNWLPVVLTLMNERLDKNGHPLSARVSNYSFPSLFPKTRVILCFALGNTRQVPVNVKTYTSFKTHAFFKSTSWTFLKKSASIIRIISLLGNMGGKFHQVLNAIPWRSQWK